MENNSYNDSIEFIQISHEKDVKSDIHILGLIVAYLFKSHSELFKSVQIMTKRIMLNGISVPIHESTFEYYTEDKMVIQLQEVQLNHGYPGLKIVVHYDNKETYVAQTNTVIKSILDTLLENHITDTYAIIQINRNIIGGNNGRN